MTDGYRPDIDGLRAVAILAVVANHATASLLPGGFAGVDIFFVISGFLISGLISKDLERGTFTLRSFYARRMKRILPAFIVLCLVTSAVSLYLLNVNDLVFFTTSLAACWVFASNIFFSLLSGGYFDPRLELFPLLHTWSLGVEEQFYFVFPLLLSFAWRRQRPRLFWLTLLLTLAFVALSQARSADPRSYFLLQYRAHELLLGLLALLARRDFPIRKGAIAEVTCATGLLMTMASLLLLDEHSGFPGLQSLWPCFGAALVIYSADQTIWCRRVLTNRPMVFVGLISYSFYLWHWPIFSFLRYRGINMTPEVIVGAVASALILSFLSWRFVEKPVRSNRRITFGRAAAYLYALPAIGFGAFAVYSYASGGIPTRVAPQIRELMSSYSRQIDLARNCSTRNIDDATVSLAHLNQKCAFGDLAQTEPQLLLFGDSHANHFRPFLDVLAKAAHIRAVYHVMGGCPPTHLTSIGGSVPVDPADTCARHNAAMLKLAGHFKYVVLGGYWSYESNPAFEAELRAVVEQIARAGATPVVFRDSPRFDNDRSQCVLRKARGWLPPETDCNIPYEAVLREQAPFDAAIDDVRQRYPQMIVIDVKEMLCNAKECESRIGNLAVYMDAQHLNAQAAQALATRYLRSHGNPFGELGNAR